MYFDKNYKGNIMSFPEQDINPALKDVSWVRSNLEFIYSQYVNDRGGVLASDYNETQILRRYKDGNQPMEIYKDWILDSKESWAGDRKAYNAINFDEPYNPFPSILSKVHGIMDEQEFAINISAIDERSSNEKKKQEFLALIKSSIPNPYPEMQQSGMQPQAPIMSDAELKVIQAMGGLKLPFEIGMMRIIDQVEEESNRVHLRRKIIDDIITRNTAFVESYVDGDGRIKWRYVDFANVSIEYTRSDGYSRSRYAGYVDTYTIAELRKMGCVESESKLKKIAASFQSYNYPGVSFSYHDKYDDRHGGYKYDAHRIPVLRGYWISLDSQYKVKRISDDGSVKIYKGKWGKEYPNSSKKTGYKTSKTVIYGGNWIIGTDIVFGGDDFDDDFKLYNMSRNERDEVELPLKGVRIEGKSMIERCKYTLDMICLNELKLQGALASAAPAGLSIDISGLENVSYASGKKLTPRDIIQIKRQTGDTLFRSSPIDGAINYSSGRPIQMEEGGIGRFLNELVILENKYRQNLVEQTGIDQMTVNSAAVKTDTPVGLSQQMQASTNNILRDIQNTENRLRLSLIRDTMYKAMVLIKYNEQTRKEYASIIGEMYINVIRAMAKDRIKNPIKWGVSVDTKPTEQQRMEVLNVIRGALNTGKSGKPLVRASEYIYMVELLKTNEGMRMARGILALREKEDEQMAMQQQQMAMQQQAQINQQLEQQKQQTMQMKEAARAQANSAVEQAKANAEVDIHEKKSNIDLETDMARRDVGLNK
jgi:hypothetical protein